MYKSVFCLFALSLASCSHTVPHTSDEVEFRLKRLESLNFGLSYMVDVDRCHINYLLCKDTKQTDCWKRLEQCMKNEYNKFQTLKKRLDL
jgi:hypothetical protein